MMSYFIRSILVFACLAYMNIAGAQHHWVLMDSSFPGLPPSIHVFRSDAPLSGRPSVAWYVEAQLADRSLRFDTDTTLGRRLTPGQFYRRNNQPHVVVNGTFFSFADNRNLNAIMKEGRLTAHNISAIPGKGRDSLMFHKVTRSAIGIDRHRKADVAWLMTDSARRIPLAFESSPVARRDPFPGLAARDTLRNTGVRWKMITAIGGGPVLVHDGRMRITNDEERMFMGKARFDLHPRTAMGYTADGKLIILAIEGRKTGVAEGASLPDLAGLFLELGASEALNLDGGGSSCLLVMGRETIKPSDKEGQRPVPGVFLIR